MVPASGRARCHPSVAHGESGKVEVVARLDSDDVSLPKYGTEWIVGPRSTLSGLWNECAAACSGDIMFQMGDDIRFRTPGWDSIVRAAAAEYPDGVYLIYGRDGIADKRMATHGATSRVWYETLGYFTWPHFSSDYGDLYRHTIAARLGRLHFVEQLYTEHLHPAVDKAPMDETHRERVERDKTDKNHEVWEKVQPHLQDAQRQLSEVIDQAAMRQAQSQTDRRSDSSEALGL